MNQDTNRKPPALRYSKPSGFYFKTKKSFFEQNAQHLSSALAKNALYASQPLRVECKICLATLPDRADITQHGVPYVLCDKCDHLNGRFDDTEAFVHAIYASGGGEAYAEAYIDPDFEDRVRDIYLPKADFLLQHLEGKAPRLVDVGCGGGYFVRACRLRGIDAHGIDVSRAMVGFGNANIEALSGESPLELVDEDGFFEAVISSDAEIISAVGVIEHLRRPHRLFQAFRDSSAEMLFYSVPMFSASVAFENVFQDVFPRQLSGGHTHLFSENSIRELNKQIGAEPIAEWRFGSDMMDLYRSLMVRLQGNSTSGRMFSKFEAGLSPTIDALQAILDEGHFCSEIHALVKRC